MARASKTNPAAPHPITMERGIGNGDAWDHHLGRYVPIHVSIVADDAAVYADSIVNLHRNQSMWEDLSLNAARFARSGGGGQGVCPSGLGEDWLAFWSKLNTGTCSGTF